MAPSSHFAVHRASLSSSHCHTSTTLGSRRPTTALPPDPPPLLLIPGYEPRRTNEAHRTCAAGAVAPTSERRRPTVPATEEQLPDPQPRLPPTPPATTPGSIRPLLANPGEEEREREREREAGEGQTGRGVHG